MWLDSELEGGFCMRIEEFRKGYFRLVADEGKVIQSKARHVDEKMDERVPDIMGSVIYLGKNDVMENYEEV